MVKKSVKIWSRFLLCQFEADAPYGFDVINSIDIPSSIRQPLQRVQSQITEKYWVSIRKFTVKYMKIQHILQNLPEAEQRKRQIAPDMLYYGRNKRLTASVMRGMTIKFPEKGRVYPGRLLFLS